MPSRPTIPPEGWTIITGAGRGLGRALALELAAKGASVCATDIDAEAARATSELAAQHGAPRTAHRRCDVTELSDFEDLAASLGDEPTGMLINNAGVACGGDVGELNPADWRWSMDVNFFGAVHGCHVFVPIMRRQARGLIVNIASAGGFLALPGAAPYSTAKAAVINLTESLAAELHGTGVGAKVVCPVFLRTEIVEDGRFPDEQSRNSGRRLVRQGRCPTAAARRIVALLRSRSVVIVPEPEGRWLRRLKSSAPSLYLRLVCAARRRFASEAGHPTT